MKNLNLNFTRNRGNNYEFYKNANYHFRKLSVTVSVPFGKKKVEGTGENMGSSSAIKQRIKK